MTDVDETAMQTATATSDFQTVDFDDEEDEPDEAYATPPLRAAACARSACVPRAQDPLDLADSVDPAVAGRHPGDRAVLSQWRSCRPVRRTTPVTPCVVSTTTAGPTWLPVDGWFLDRTESEDLQADPPGRGIHPDQQADESTSPTSAISLRWRSLGKSATRRCSSTRIIFDTEPGDVDGRASDPWSTTPWLRTTTTLPGTRSIGDHGHQHRSTALRERRQVQATPEYGANTRRAPHHRVL